MFGSGESNPIQPGTTCTIESLNRCGRLGRMLTTQVPLDQSAVPALKGRLTLYVSIGPRRSRSRTNSQSGA
jgi:hypothetical protein